MDNVGDNSARVKCKVSFLYIEEYKWLLADKRKRRVIKSKATYLSPQTCYEAGEGQMQEYPKGTLVLGIHTTVEFMPTKSNIMESVFTYLLHYEFESRIKLINNNNKEMIRLCIDHCFHKINGARLAEACAFIEELYHIDSYFTYDSATDYLNSVNYLTVLKSMEPRKVHEFADI